MTTKKAISLIEQLNPIIKKSTNYIRRLEIDEEDKSIKFINLFGGILHRHYYSMDADCLDTAYAIFDYLTDRPGFIK